MAKLNINDLGEMTLTDAHLTQVKGGPAYLKLGDIKGESRAKVDSISIKQ